MDGEGLTVCLLFSLLVFLSFFLSCVFLCVCCLLAVGRKERTRRVTAYILKPVCLLGALYFFICSLGMLSDSFQLLGGKDAGDALGKSELFNNPLAGLMIGVLATVLVQSSSTTTSIIVALTASRVSKWFLYTLFQIFKSKFFQVHF